MVARVYNALPPDLRRQTAIFGQNYGQAGAIDLFGPKYGLPPAISGHQSYFLWGPRDYTGASVIVMAGQPAGFGAPVCQRAKGRQRLPSVLHALRALRRVLLPGPEAAAAGALAASEELGLTAADDPRAILLQIDRTGIATTSSMRIASFTTNGSPYFTPIWFP